MNSQAEAALLNNLTEVLRDLHERGTQDGEAMFYLGAGADWICKTGQETEWPALKPKLSTVETVGLLAQIDAEGRTAVAKGQDKQGYALQALGLSIAAIGAEDPKIQAARDLLDDLIVTALANYRKHAPKGPAPVN